jgi:polar amino acid transport system substrate-binding protein
MKRFILVPIFLFAMFMTMSEESVNVGVFLHSPYVEKGATEKDCKGAGIDYVGTVLKELGYAPKFIVLPFPRVLSSLETGDIDVAFDLAKNPDREKFAYFTEKPAMTVSAALVVRTGSPLRKVTSVNDLKGMTIGYLLGSTVPKVLDFPDVYKFDLVSGDNWINNNLTKLLDKRIDAALDLNPYSFVAEAKRIGAKNKIRVLPIPGNATEFYVLFSKKSKLGSDLHTGFDRIITSNKISYSKIIEDSLK